MDKKFLFLIIGIIIGLILGSVLGYFSNGFFRQNSLQRNFQISDEQKTSVTNFFDSTNNLDEITNYCNENRMICFYYCRNINPSLEYCTNLQNSYNRGAP